MDNSGGPILRHHPTFGTLYVPQLRKRVVGLGVGYNVRTNSDGFRADREFSRTRTPGARRVLMFGDSQAAGDFVSNGKRFSDVIEKKLDQVEVYNLALTGSGTDQQYLINREFAPKLPHDLTVICVFVDNILRVQQKVFVRPNPEGTVQYYGKPYFEIEKDKLALHGVPTPERPWTEETVPDELRDPEQQRDKKIAKPKVQWRRFIPHQLLQWFVPLVRRVVRRRSADPYSNPNSLGWRLMRLILESWIVESPAPVLLVPLPLWNHFLTESSDTPAYSARFAELAASTGSHVYDPLSDLLSVPPAERRLLWDHRTVHLSEAGHRFIGDKLAARIEHLLPPVAAPKVAEPATEA